MAERTHRSMEVGIKILAQIATWCAYRNLRQTRTFAPQTSGVTGLYNPEERRIHVVTPKVNVFLQAPMWFRTFPSSSASHRARAGNRVGDFPLCRSSKRRRMMCASPSCAAVHRRKGPDCTLHSCPFRKAKRISAHLTAPIFPLAIDRRLNNLQRRAVQRKSRQSTQPLS